MKQIAITAPFKIEVLDVPKPRPQSDQILTKTLVSGVSIGTELIDYRGAMEKLPEKWKKVHPYTFPQLPGYENVGEVVEVGAKVKDLKVGDRVVHCGYHAEYCIVPRRDALPVYEKLPDSVSDEDATLSVLGTTAIWAIHRAELEYGDNVVVQGDGCVGILTAMQAMHAGTEKVILVGNHPGKLAIARKAGIKTTICRKDRDWQKQVMAETNGLGADVVIECVGSSTEPTSAVPEACEIVRQKGKIVIAGDHMAGQPDLIFLADPHFKELTFIVSRAMGNGSHHPFLIDALEKVQEYNYVHWTTVGLFKQVVKMIADGRLKVHPLITHRFKYQQVAEAFKRIDAKKEDFVQVLLTDW
jgi:2-desacetyl-2-hydroxyethyl bacteriochlorophyllide A dehydrogenase